MKKYIIVFIFILAILLRIGLFSKKNDLFYDEVLNMTAANHNELYYNRSDYFEKNKIFDGYELKQKLLINNPTLKDMFSDIRNLHKYSGDVLHTNLYYSLARIMFFGADKYNLNDYLVRIGGLNLILFSLSFFFMYKLLNLLFNDKKYIPTGLIFAYFNPASISNTLFLREYQLQELFVVLIAYLGVFYYKNKIHLKDIPLISTIMALALLSGYYIGFFVFCFFIMLLIKKDFKTFFLSGITTLIILLCLYPQYFGFFISKFVHTYSQTAQISLNLPATPAAPSTPVWMGIIKYPIAIYHFICSYLLMFYFIVIACKTPKTGNKKAILTITSLALIWVVIVLTTSPFKITRYILPVIPLCTLILTWILECSKKNKVLVTALSLLLLHTTFVTLNTFLNINSMKFSNIKLKEKQNIIFEEKTDLPIYISTKNYETLGDLITHINNERKVIFTDISDIKDNHFYMCTDNIKNPVILKPEKIINAQHTIFYYCIEILDK